MTWTAYRVVFKLKSPIHIGCGKVGNVQRTRPYVTGRSFWGALTMRLTRNQHHPATDSRLYEEVGKQVHDQLAYTYFYPATKASSDYEIHFPWKDESQFRRKDESQFRRKDESQFRRKDESQFRRKDESQFRRKDESQFRRRFLSSYASTALVYPQQAADEGLLHEVEFLSPRTLDEGQQVYLIGYVFEREGCDLQWRNACKRLQMGGERGYGWGDVQCVEMEEVTDTQLFCANYHLQKQGSSVVIQVSESSHLLAHTVTQSVSAQGEIEPLVGREWKVSNQAGQHVEKFGDICWVPGSVVERSRSFVIRDFGIWHSPT